ncbi:MAG: FxsA family protein [Nocardioides sp.]
MRKWIPWWVLALLFVVVPVIEIYLLIQVGQGLGAWWTVALLIAAGFLGSWLVKREGGRAWTALQQALNERRMPARELADGALILIGGTLLLTPGFLSDVAGLFCILPTTRPLARGVLTRVISRKFVVVGGASPRTRQRPGPDESVVQGEVVD